MVTAMLGILIPLTSTLILNTYNAYVEVSMINRMAASGDNSLRSVTKDITIMKKIKKADASNLYFTLIGVGERYYRFEDVNNTFQLCMDDCVIPPTFVAARHTFYRVKVLGCYKTKYMMNVVTGSANKGGPNHNLVSRPHGARKVTRSRTRIHTAI